MLVLRASYSSWLKAWIEPGSNLTCWYSGIRSFFRSADFFVITRFWDSIVFFLWLPGMRFGKLPGGFELLVVAWLMCFLMIPRSSVRRSSVCLVSKRSSLGGIWGIGTPASIWLC